ncbi:MAG TPA: gliding motility-associated C-terminal domain-containing protein, partial [Candidatus Onthomorpha intestinigallinarum]|nr:gliding motility-associated C-terminal domain-containing protein [Candidatus Onthomorpha intestinigallinarum]
YLEPHQTRCNNESNGYVTATTDGFAEPVFFQWSNGQGGEGLDSIGDLSVGNYTLTITDANGCIATQEFEISSPSDLDVDFQKTDNPCQGVCAATITLNPTGGVAPYAIEWQDGSTELSLSGLCTGDYVYELTDAQGCKYNDTIEILQLDTVRLNVVYGENLCPEGCSATAEAVVSGGTLPYSYQWSNGENAAMLTDLCSGDYSLQVKDANGCQCEESFSITYTDVFEDFWVSASQDRVYDGQVVTLSSKHIPQMNYSWYPSENLVAPHSSSTDALMYESTMFYVYVTDNKGCDLKDSVFVHVDVVNCGKPNIYVPNIFTPNGDGKNDAVFVKGDWIDSFIFEIYDRWGEKVFSTNRLDEGWDGTYKGNRCDAAVYYYRLEVKCQGGKTYTGSGDITLIR